MNSSVGPIIRRTVFDGVTFSYLMLVLLVTVVGPSEEQLLQLGRNFALFMAFLPVGALISFVLNNKGVRTLGEVLFAPPHKRQFGGLPKPWYKTFWGIETLVVLMVTLIVGVFVTQISLVSLLDEDRIGPAMVFMKALFTPAWEVLPEAVLRMIETIYIAFMATAIAVPAAFVLSFASAKNVMGSNKRGFAVYMFLRIIFNVSRSVEPIIWAIIFSLRVGFGPFAGMLALMIHSIASLAKQYSEYVESVEEGPIEGIRSTGANMLQTIWFAIVPQVVLPYISYTIYRWDTNVRMATIIGFVGGGGIGKLLIEYQMQGAWSSVGCILLVISFVVWVMDAFSSYVREAVK